MTCGPCKLLGFVDNREAVSWVTVCGTIFVQECTLKRFARGKTELLNHTVVLLKDSLALAEMFQFLLRESLICILYHAFLGHSGCSDIKE